jgi:L,D-peptidoglycan transpeptidase YkuD (ErfK/YbiS/YcfS/YnhG family)
MTMRRLFSRRLLASVAPLIFAGCVTGNPHLRPPVPPADCSLAGALAGSGGLPAATAQLLLVTAPAGETAATVFACENRDGRWVDALPSIAGMIGRSGFAEPGGKREGDGKTPTGVFRLQTAFGYAPAAPTGMPYRQVTADDLWVDDSAAPDYNRWVRRGETTAASWEEMRRPDGLYKYGLIIEYNTQPIVPGAGSAIFLHLWRGSGQATEGCVAMAEGDLLTVLGWLDPAKAPATLLGTAEMLRKLSEG